MKQLSRILIIVLFLITSLGVVPGLASPDIPPSPIYLPFVSFIGGGSISISGTALDTDAYPIANVTIRDNYGFSAVTDENGEYTLSTRKGENLLTAQNPGFTFEPEELSLNPSGDLSGQDFHGVVACGDIMVNGKVTAGDGGWDFPAKDPAYATAHTDSTIFRSPPTSGRTGIPVGKANADVHSNVISQKYHIPSDANHVLLSVHLYPQSTDLSDLDRQYVKILDSNNNPLQVLWNGHKNDTDWNTYFEWEINSYVGETIKIEIGTYNDGVGGVSRMYFDDVQLLICKQEVPPPACNKVINSDFEDGYTGWTIPSGQIAPPVISTVHAKSGTHSMKTGNTYTKSFSEFYQDVDIPVDAANATLKFHVYTKSEEVAAAAPDINLLLSMPQEGDSWNSILAPETDVQYAYVMDTSNNVLKKLMWWPNSNTDSWTYMEFDLNAYKGQTVRLKFGTYNDGHDGKSTMWVDTVYLIACTPSSGCYEALSNRSFESNTAWVIPTTAYTAGYSTLKAHTGNRSMRSGIYYPSHNIYSYSDFRQKVTIPSNSTSAELKVWIWPKSTQPDAKIGAPLIEPQIVNGKLQMSPDSSDGQYILVLNKYGYILDQLWWKFPPRDDQSWNSHVFNLMPWKGKTIYLQFGVSNNGLNGITSMFVDDASVIICNP